MELAKEGIVKDVNRPTPLGSKLRAKLRQLPQYTRTWRHAWTILRHSTPRKLVNLAVVEAEYRLRRTQVRGKPYILIVDPTTVCNLKCPLCPTGTGDLGRKKQMIPWETFTRIVDEFAPYAYELNMHNWGESVLHPHIFDMIAYAKERNLATNMSANFNIMKRDSIERLVDSGLEYLCLSIDGASQDTYSKYRVKGNLDTVLENARKLVARKREVGSATPLIEWQFIVFKHNAHEIEAAREMANQMGIDRFRVIPPGLAFDAPNQRELKKEWFVPIESDGDGEDVEDFRDKVAETSCFYLYRSMTTNPDGGVAPCCIVYGNKNDFGNVLEENPRDIWNNEQYQSARSLYRKNGDVTHATVCDRCTIFRKHL